MLNTLKSLLRRFLKKQDTERVFTSIYKKNAWKGRNSISGSGSDLGQTQFLIKYLPVVLKDYEIKTMVDIPCGDFNWMQRVNLDGVKYIGADIVGEIVDKNNAAYSKDNVIFKRLDIINEKLPKADLVFVRDCLVHFSYNHIQKALKNIINSESQYLLTTTFPNRSINKDILTGSWRPLNLEIAPFSLPAPLEMFNENCTENNLIYKDKSLGLWEIEKLKKQ